MELRLLHLADDGVLEPLAEVNEPTGEAPLALAGGVAALDEEHAVAVEHDGAHGDARGVRELAHGFRHASASSPAPCPLP